MKTEKRPAPEMDAGRFLVSCSEQLQRQDEQAQRAYQGEDWQRQRPRSGASPPVAHVAKPGRHHSPA